MFFTRCVLTVVAFAAALWFGVRVLDVFGRSGWAGRVIARNLDERVDATPLFYTELERVPSEWFDDPK